VNYGYSYFVEQYCSISCDDFLLVYK